MSSIDLQNKVVVVMGGTTGLGLSASRAFVEAGAAVVAVGRNLAHVKRAQSALGARACVISADATHPSTAPQAIRSALKQFGAFDGLYHVAGGSGRKAGDGPLHEITNDGWEYTMHLNLTSLFYSNRAAVQQFLKQDSDGAILNMTSVLGFSPSPHHFGTHAYAAAKAAVVGWTRSCAAYYASHNIRFNALAPALVQTPMAERAAGNAAIMKFIATKQPLEGGRIGQPADLDAAAVYLLSDASRFVTGQVIAIDGGWSVSEGQLSPPVKRSVARNRSAARGGRPR